MAMKIKLRTSTGWLYKIPNKAKHNCDLCGAKLWMDPGGGIYCNQVHEMPLTKAQ